MGEWNSFRERQKINQERYQLHSRKRLMNNMKKKFQTNMIGALDIFEKNFGSLWGHGKDVNDLDINELEHRKVWEYVRNKILDNGNQQLRGAMDEINEYTMTWNRYTTEFIIKKDNDYE